MKFYGSLEELKALVEDAGCIGEWTQEGTTARFDGRKGEIVKLYANKTLQTQGKNGGEIHAYLEAVCHGGEALQRKEPVKREVEAAAPAKIFIVHGHDEAARNELELILRRLNLLPFILQNSSSGSKTLIEALEARIINDAAFGIVLVTPDDVGYSIRDGEAGAKARARQNVVLEMGMVMAALSRSRMVIIKKRGDVELPSDTDGIVRLEYQTRVQEQVPGLVQHLMDAGIAVDPALIADAAR